jgi:hypothetical protein
VGIIVSDSVSSSELDFVNVRLSVMDSDGERVVVVVSDNVSVGCNDAVEESEWVADCDCEVDSDCDADCEVDCEALSESERDADSLNVKLAECVTLTEFDMVAVAVNVDDHDGERVWLGESEYVKLSVRDGDSDTDSESDSVAEYDTETVGVRESLRVNDHVYEVVSVGGIDADAVTCCDSDMVSGIVIDGVCESDSE